MTQIENLSSKLYELLKEKNIMISTAESCTGGLIGKTLTDIPGISAHYGYGFITYSNEAKQNLLGVKRETLELFGAVSSDTVKEMVTGALLKSGADVAVSVSGIAGPGGGSAEKPVGLVYIGVKSKENDAKSHRFIFDGTREEVRQKTVEKAIELVIEEIENIR
ncbi:MAG: CinA family protein [Clostridia bacterium]|nr:CinA family protein [Clostridia bacterium]